MRRLLSLFSLDDSPASAAIVAARVSRPSPRMLPPLAMKTLRDQVAMQPVLVIMLGGASRQPLQSKVRT